MRLAILSMAHVHAPGLAAWARQNGHLAGIWDDNAARGQQAAVQYGTLFEPDLEKLLLSVDGVVITAENVKHTALAVAAARAGKHILCEKPLATTVEDARTMITAAREAGVVLMTAMPCRFHPTFTRVKAAIAAGEIGRVVGIAGTNQGLCPMGWFVEPDLAGGGTIMDHTVHVVDIMRHLIGSEVASVYALAGTRFHPGLKVEDCGYLSMAFENGVIASLDPSWSRPQPYKTWGNVRLEVVGTEGTISLDMFSQSLDVWVNGHQEEGWGSDAGALMLQSFLDACTKGTPVVVTGEDGLRSAEVAVLAYRSVREGRPVSRS